MTQSAQCVRNDDVNDLQLMSSARLILDFGFSGVLGRSAPNWGWGGKPFVSCGCVTPWLFLHIYEMSTISIYEIACRKCQRIWVMGMIMHSAVLRIVEDWLLL